MSDTPRTETYVLNPLPQVVSAEWARQLERELNAANDRIKRLEDCAEIAWGIIANVDDGSWQEQRSDWREAAIRWRDEQYAELSERKAKEAKP